MIKESIKNTFVYHYYRGDKCIDYKALLRIFLDRWFKGNALAVGWLLCGDETVGSSRIHGLNISRELERQGVKSYIIQKPNYYKEELQLDEFTLQKLLKSKLDVVVFQRVHRNAGEFVRKLQAVGKKAVFIMADFFETEMPTLCDHTIVISESLKCQLVQRGVQENLITVIPDPIETDYSQVKSYLKDQSDNIKVVWVGAAGNWPSLKVIEHALQDDSLKDYKLITISNHEKASISWDYRTVWDHILDCDIAVIPVDLTKNESLAKSNNRLTMFKALGLPVICSPLPSYRGVISHGESGYMATTDEEWIRFLKELKDPDLRHKIALAGREKIFAQYGIEAIGNRYLDLFLSIAGKHIENRTN